jgi:hydrogenase maturation protease
VQENILIVGVGNPFRRDDGIGLAVIQKLSQEKLSGYDLKDGRTDALALIDVLSDYKYAIIVDAVCMSESPGTIKIFTPNEIKDKVKADALSTHGFGLAEMFKLIKQLKIKTQIKIVGIEPKNISYGEGLTQELTQRLEKIIQLIKNISF